MPGAVGVLESVLPGLSAETLSATYPDVLGGLRLPTDLFLLHLSTHLSLHLGQVGYLRRILTGDGAPTRPAVIPTLPNPA